MKSYLSQMKIVQLKESLSLTKVKRMRSWKKSRRVTQGILYFPSCSEAALTHVSRGSHPIVDGCIWMYDL